MFDEKKLIFIHGSDSSSQTYKATLLRRQFPDMVAPDFTGSLEERMIQLEQILGNAGDWTIIGSSLGGTMAALFAALHPERVRKLILLAPALILLDFTKQVKTPIRVPCVIVQGSLDEIVPLEENRKVAEKFFPNLDFMVVEDDHRLHKTAEVLEWRGLLE